jgi:hypothetical protein
VYSVSIERFRKAQERMLVEEVAEAILARCRQRLLAVGGTSPEPAGESMPGTTYGARSADDPAAGGTRRAGTVGGSERSVRWQRLLRTSTGEVPVTLHLTPIDLLTDIDILVSSENVYLQAAQTFKSSISACLRLAGARTNSAGEIVDDIISRELAAWLRDNGRSGLPVAPGTVATTSPGELAKQGIRRVYHAAMGAALLE